jgi:5-methylcytosine-specific restriction endonuclease McrA
MSYVPVALRSTVIERAGGRCEYCLYPQAASFLAFEIEHIISEKHGGKTVAENLALACPYCNRFKGSTWAHSTPIMGC